MEIKRGEKKRRKKGEEDENRKIRKLKKQVKESRQMVSLFSNEIHRRKVKRKATNREKRILERLRNTTQNQLTKKEELLMVKEI